MSTTTIPHYWGTGKNPDGTAYDAQLTPDDLREMQTIDADCNDCRHFARGQFHKAPGLHYFEGHCRKFDKPAKAYPRQYSGHECFEHRRAVA